MSEIAEKTDEQLVELILSQDKELYAEIVSRYQAPLLRYSRSILKDEDAAEDAVQNAFIKAYRNLRSFRTDLKFSSWMYRITHNESINVLNKSKRELRPDDDDWFDRLESNMATPDEDVERLLLEGKTAAALAGLKPSYREPLFLYAFEAKSYKEISNILKIPTATVGTRIKRAKEQLKKQLLQKGIEGSNG